MAVITLTTDWGTRDFFVAALKGELLKQCPNVPVIDISHHVKQYDIIEGALILRNSWSHYPEGTVHVVGLIAHGGHKSSAIALKHKGHYFIGNNDGFFSLAFDEVPSEKYYIMDAKGAMVIPSLQVLADSAAYLAKGGKVSDMGKPVDDYLVKTMFQPYLEDDSISGAVIYQDSFGNLITNVTSELFNRIGGGRAFEIHLRMREYMLSNISTDYKEAGPGNMLVLFNSSGYLEIAICEGNAAELLYLRYGDTIRIDFLK
ncbi:MAG TPA: SAM-dependent chlorinase/fluorinase [Bacteroidia bacterium]|nr:SAM-dependent chlorinase/fluorinase [Bacteroidia bacterium]